MTNIAIVGTGFVADYYMTSLANYPGLNLAGVWDRDGERLAQFCAFYSIKAYSDFGALLNDPCVDIIVNLTTPESHFEINSRALEAGKHVYCEKPLAMTLDDAAALGALAKNTGQRLHSAPANAFSPAFAETARLLESGAIGQPSMVYAEMEDGPVFWDNWQEWRSLSGAKWPGLHEFEIGCTLEHAGYGLSWLLALFGPVTQLSASSQLVFPDKGPGTEHLDLAPDLTVGLLSLGEGVSARLSCGLAVERDRSFTVVGNEGILKVADLWDWTSPIRLQKRGGARSLGQRGAGWLERRKGETSGLSVAAGEKVSYGSSLPNWNLPKFPSRIDFAAGIAAQADAIASKQTGFFSGDVSVHLTEVTLALQMGEVDFKPPTQFQRRANYAATLNWPKSVR